MGLSGPGNRVISGGRDRVAAGSGFVDQNLHGSHGGIFRKGLTIPLEKTVCPPSFAGGEVLLREGGDQLSRVGICGYPALENLLSVVAVAQPLERCGQVREGPW